MKYRHSKPAPSTFSTPPVWLWLLTGVGLGLVIAGLFSMRQPSVKRQVEILPVVSVKGQVEANEDTAFEFYHVLPEMEVLVEPVVKSEPSSQEQSRSANLYHLQFGSFRSFEEADALKAKLAIEGFESDVRRAQLASGETWYRVVSVEAMTFDDVARARDRLLQHRFDSMIIKQG